MPTRVVNARRDHFDVYVGRAGHGEDGYFGNPYRVVDGDRESALVQFEVYFLNRVQLDAEFRRRVLGLRGKTLGCFCKPARCHADFIAAWIDSQPEE